MQDKKETEGREVSKKQSELDVNQPDSDISHFMPMEIIEEVVESEEAEKEFVEKMSTPLKYEKGFSRSRVFNIMETPIMPSTSAKTTKEPTMTAKVYTYPSECYDGELDEEFVRNGYGIYEYHNGDIYEGEFLEGQRHGKGEYLYCDGAVYRGYWREDAKHGKGSFKYDKYEFDGEWEDDVLINGFTFKINTFIRMRSEKDYLGEEEYEHNDSDINGSRSSDSVDIDPDRVDDDEYVRQILAERYKSIHSKDYNIDIDLYHIKSGDNKTNLMNKILTNRLPTFEEESETVHDEYCELYREQLAGGSPIRSNYKCHCIKFKKIIPKLTDD